MRLFYIFHGRYPSERAAALFVEESTKAYAAHGPVVVVAPRRLGRGAPAPAPNVRVVYLPTLDLFTIPFLSPVAFFVSYVCFSAASFVYLLFAVGKDDVVETNEPLPGLLATLVSAQVVFELHDFPGRAGSLYRLLFRRAKFVLATNEWKRRELADAWGVPPEKIIVERNGVDTKRFAPGDKQAARRALNLPEHAALAVYTGHLYEWKGVDTLARAAEGMPDVHLYVVGGTPDDAAAFGARHHASNIHVVGHRPHDEIPLWQAAADVLVLPNTAQEEISAHYTSPMKLFEYMASGRPIVASRVPSVEEVVGEGDVFFAEPDNPRSFAAAIQEALRSPDAPRRAQRVRERAEEYTWDARARRLCGRFGPASDRPGFVRSFVLVPLVYAALVVGILSPFLFGGAVSIGADITTYYYPAFNFYHDALVSGQSFLWNPLIFSGFPTYLSQVGGYFDPLNSFLFRFLDGYDGLHVRLFVDYMLMLVASYAAARAFGLSRLASFGVGLGYFMAFNHTVISNPLFANSAYIMPLLVLVLGKVRHRCGFDWRWGLFGGVGVGFAFLSGYAQVVIMALTLFGICGLLYGIVAVRSGRMRFVARFLGLCGMIGGVGFLIGSPQILPALAFTPLTRRGGGVEYALASLKSLELGDALLFLYPDYNYFPYVSVGRKALFVGALWFLSAAGLVRMLWRSVSSTYRREALVFLMTLLITVAIAIEHSPVFYALQQLPVFSLFRFSDRWMYVGSFFIAFLGGYGFDALSRAPAEAYLRRWYIWVTAPVVLFLGWIVFLNAATVRLLESLGALFSSLFGMTLYGRGPFTKDPAHYEAAFVRGLEAWKELTSFGDLSFAAPTAALVAALALLWAYVLGRLSPARFRIWGILLMATTAAMAVSFQFENKLMRAEVAHLQETSFVQFVPAGDRALFRYYPVFISAAFAKFVPPTYTLTPEQIKAQNELAFASGWTNTNMNYGMASVDGYEVFVTNPYINTLALAGSTFGAQDYTRSIPPEELVARLESYADVLGMMGGKYVVSGIPLEMPDLRPVGMYSATAFNIPLYVYENRLALPRVYVAPRVVRAAGELPEFVAAGNRGFVRQTYLDCATCSLDAGRGSIEERVFKNGNAFFTVSMEEPGWLVFSESFLPGWEVLVDGDPAELVRANGLYMAVAVPPGTHTVEFTYRGMPVLYI